MRRAFTLFPFDWLPYPLFYNSVRVMFSIADLESEQPEFEEEAAEGEEEEPIGAIFPLRCSITVTKVNFLPSPVRHFIPY